MSPMQIPNILVQMQIPSPKIRPLPKIRLRSLHALWGADIWGSSWWGHCHSSALDDPHRYHTYSLVMTNSLLLKMTIEIISIEVVDFPITSWWFSIAMLNYQRVPCFDSTWELNYVVDQHTLRVSCSYQALQNHLAITATSQIGIDRIDKYNVFGTSKKTSSCPLGLSSSSNTVF